MNKFRGGPLPDWFITPPVGLRWNVLPVGYLFRKYREIPGPDKADTYQRLSLTMNGVLPRSRQATDGLQPDSFDSYQLLKPNQIVFKLIDLENISTSRVGLSRDEGLVSPAYLIVEPSDKVVPRYAYWYFMDLYLRQIYNNLAKNGVRAALGWESLKELPFPLLSLNQQTRIADFLDTETAKIDRLIAKQRELIDLLHLRNEARWHAAFTGFTPVKTRPLKRLLVKLRRPVLEGSGVVTAFRDGEVTLRSNRREEGFTFSEAETGYQGVAAGDLVFHGLDGFAGAVGISDSDGQSTPVYHVCRLRDDEDNLRFIAYLLRYLGHSGFLATQAPSVRQRAVDFRNWQTFGQIPLSLPDPEEQQRIVTELDKNAAEFLNTKTTIEKAIELLQERRSALITAAVTGQIEV